MHSMTKSCLFFSLKSLKVGSDYARDDSGGWSSENAQYDFSDAEKFRTAYRTHFSDSFHKIFSEVLATLLLKSVLAIKMIYIEFAGILGLGHI